MYEARTNRLCTSRHVIYFRSLLRPCVFVWFDRQA